MFQGSNPWQLVDAGQRDYRKFIELKDGQGADMVVSPYFYKRGQAGPQGIATFAAGAASGTVEQVTLTLNASQDPPEWIEVVVINHADATVTAQVNQTVNDFVLNDGTSTVTPEVSTGSTQIASGGSASFFIHFPFTTDGPLVIPFSADATMTNGGKVGAQIRWLA